MVELFHFSTAVTAVSGGEADSRDDEGVALPLRTDSEVGLGAGSCCSSIVSVWLEASEDDRCGGGAALGGS